LLHGYVAIRSSAIRPPARQAFAAGRSGDPDTGADHVAIA
jgi:hypothetical protein